MPGIAHSSSGTSDDDVLVAADVTEIFLAHQIKMRPRGGQGVLVVFDLRPWLRCQVLLIRYRLAIANQIVGYARPAFGVEVTRVLKTPSLFATVRRTSLWY